VNSNEHPGAYGYQPSRFAARDPSRPRVNEETLKSGIVQIEKKTFHFAMKENVRGRLLRITEETSGRRNAIIIPATGLAEFQALFLEMAQAATALPAKEISSPAKME
jgi:hypothetical protein